MNATPVVAIDLGGTKIRAAVVDDRGRILGEDRRPTCADEGQAVVLDRMAESARRAIERSGVASGELVAIGISGPGPCDSDRGVLLQPPNLPGWEAVPLAALVQERLGLPAILENDANAAALGEHRLGAGQGARHLIYLTVSTGVGGGLILDGSRVAGVGRFVDVDGGHLATRCRPRQALRPAGLGGLGPHPADRRARGHHLEATAHPAGVQRPLLVDRDVPQLTRRPVGAVVAPPVQDQPPADPGAHGQVDQVPGALAGPQPELAQRGRVGVVLQHRRQAQTLLD